MQHVISSGIPQCFAIKYGLPQPSLGTLGCPTALISLKSMPTDITNMINFYPHTFATLYMHFTTFPQQSILTWDSMEPHK